MFIQFPKWSLCRKALICLFLTQSLTANEIKNVRIWPAPDKTRIVFDLTQPISHKLILLHQPERVAIDIPKARLVTNLSSSTPANSTLLSKIRYSTSPDNIRIVLDLNQAATVRSFVLSPNELYNYRLVVDLYESSPKEPPKPQAAKAKVLTPTPSAQPEILAQPKGRDLIIAIDAGHGGDDPGAIGPKGAREKHITMSIAKNLAKLIEKETGMNPLLTRKGDYYLGLRERIDLARKGKSDIFISIHADSYKSRKVGGSSVYVLSDRRASSEAAKWLAERENLSDLVGGVEKVSWNGRDTQLASILFDLIQGKTRKDSFSVGQVILKNLGQVNKLHKSSVQQAGFVVLRAPDMPSILVESAFLSNPREEQRLIQQPFQKQLAQAVLKGVKNYFAEKPPEGTYFFALQQNNQAPAAKSTAKTKEAATPVLASRIALTK